MELEGLVWKNRLIDYLYEGDYQQSTDNGSTWAHSPQLIKFQLGERTQSMSHGKAVKFLHKSRVGSTQANIGGPFYNETASFEPGPNSYLTPPLYRKQGTIVRIYDGYAFPIDPGILSAPPLAAISNLALSGYGNTARSRIDPTNPNGQLLTAIGELFNDGVPTITGVQTWKNRTQAIRKNAGHEYLNVEFGWKPLVSDILSTASNVKRAAKLLRQREKNVGKPLRRRYNFPRVSSEGVKTTISTNVYPYPIGVWPQFGSGTRGNVVRTRSLDWDVWFSGSFTYYVSPGSYSSRLLRYEKQADILLGTRLTPEVIWNLAPWSWAIDWHVDFGAMLGNLSRMILDGSIMWYGYVMSHQVIRDVYTHTNVTSLEMTFKREIKQRAMATPFGFGLNPSTDYSARQLAIIAALGISL